MNSEKILGEELAGLIRQIVQEEVRRILYDKVENTAKAQVLRNHHNGYCDVYIVEAEKTVRHVLNRANEEIVEGDYVKIYYSHNNYSDGYIGYKY